MKPTDEKAQQTAREIGAVLVSEECAYCQWPLMKFERDVLGFHFCWNCQASPRIPYDKLH
jgi:uncharacterized Zn finger protein (UPF0148 family)